MIEKIDCKLVLPMAGLGTRVPSNVPKPLYNIEGRAMFMQAVDSLELEFSSYLFIVLKEHNDIFRFDVWIPRLYKNATVAILDELQDGTVCSVLKCENLIKEEPIVICFSDLIVEGAGEAIKKLISREEVGGICCDEREPSKNLSCIIPDGDRVVKVYEKEDITSFCTSGQYYWKNGSDFIKYAKNMVNKKININGEYYVALVYNEAIEDNKSIGYQMIKHFWSLGNDEEIQEFKNNIKHNQTLII